MAKISLWFSGIFTAKTCYQKMHMSYLRGMSGYLLVADGTRRQTLDDALALNERVVHEFGKSLPLLLLNKFDLTEPVGNRSGAEFASSARPAGTRSAHQRQNRRRSRRRFPAARASDAGKVNVRRNSIFESFFANQGFALFEYLGAGEFQADRRWPAWCQALWGDLPRASAKFGWAIVSHFSRILF